MPCVSHRFQVTFSMSQQICESNLTQVENPDCSPHINRNKHGVCLYSRTIGWHNKSKNIQMQSSSAAPILSWDCAWKVLIQLCIGRDTGYTVYCIWDYTSQLLLSLDPASTHCTGSDTLHHQTVHKPQLHVLTSVSVACASYCNAAAEPRYWMNLIWTWFAWMPVIRKGDTTTERSNLWASMPLSKHRLSA